MADQGLITDIEAMGRWYRALLVVQACAPAVQPLMAMAADFDAFTFSQPNF